MEEHQYVDTTFDTESMVQNIGQIVHLELFLDIVSW